MGTQPVSPAINLSKSEMTGGLALLTVKQKKKKKKARQRQVFMPFGLLAGRVFPSTGCF